MGDVARGGVVKGGVGGRTQGLVDVRRGWGREWLGVGKVKLLQLGSGLWLSYCLTVMGQNAHAYGAKGPGRLLAPTCVGVLTTPVVKTPT